MRREIIYKDFNSNLIIYKKAAALGNNIYKGYFTIYRRVFINIFNRMLIITVRRNIIYNRAFGSIYNGRLAIITKRYLLRDFADSDIIIFFLIVLEGFVLRFFVRGNRTFILRKFLIVPGIFNRNNNLILGNLSILRGFPPNRRKGILITNKYFNYIDLIPKKKKPSIY